MHQNAPETSYLCFTGAPVRDCEPTVAGRNSEGKQIAGIPYMMHVGISISQININQIPMKKLLSPNGTLAMMNNNIMSSQTGDCSFYKKFVSTTILLSKKNRVEEKHFPPTRLISYLRIITFHHNDPIRY